MAHSATKDIDPNDQYKTVPDSREDLHPHHLMMQQTHKSLSKMRNQTGRDEAKNIMKQKIVDLDAKASQEKELEKMGMLSIESPQEDMKILEPTREEGTCYELLENKNLVGPSERGDECIVLSEKADEEIEAKRQKMVSTHHDRPSDTGRIDTVNQLQQPPDFLPSWRFITPNENERNDGKSAFRDKGEGDNEGQNPHQAKPADCAEHESYKKWTKTIRKNKNNEWMKDEVNPQTSEGASATADDAEREQREREFY